MLKRFHPHAIFFKGSLPILLILLSILLSDPNVYAYYNRGTVQLSLGTNVLTITQGSTATIPVTLTPSYRTGLAGCGMAECPQSCGGMCGDEMTGECGCVPGDPITKYALASIQNNNLLIAEATYSQTTGLITIKGLNTGTAQLTVTGTLWQYTSSAPQTITVKVVDKPKETLDPGSSSGGTPASSNSPTSSSSPASSSIPSSGNSSSSDSSPPSNNGSSSGSNSSDSVSSNETNADDDSKITVSNNTIQTATEVPVVTINGDAASETTTGPETTTNSAVSEDSMVIENTLRGKIEMITLGNDSMTGKEYFSSAMEDGRQLTFQKLDSSSNVIYSWTFNGSSIKTPMDIDFSITISNTAPVLKRETMNLVTPLYITFSQHGELPGEASITINVQKNYKDGETVSLYYLNEDTGTVELVAENLTVEGGYITFTIDHCSSYAFSGIAADNAADWDSSRHTDPVRPARYIILALILTIAAGITAFYFIRKKRIQK